MLKLFTTIKEVAEDPASLVIILIDEVESIAYSRGAVSAQEPSDSLRVVNAVLTQLDQLRTHSNVLVLTTSNLSGSIDLAFVDRADLKQYVGFPSPIAIFHIFKSAIDELIKVVFELEISAQSRHHTTYRLLIEKLTGFSFTGQDYHRSQFDRRGEMEFRKCRHTVGHCKKGTRIERALTT